MNRITDPLARFLVSALFLASGLMKITHFADTSSMIAGIGIPLASLAAVMSIAIEVGGAIAIIVGWHTKLAAWLQFLYLIVVTVTLHKFWAATGAMQQDQIAHFMKNVSIMGALLILAGRGAGESAVDVSGK